MNLMQNFKSLLFLCLFGAACPVWAAPLLEKPIASCLSDNPPAGDSEKSVALLESDSVSATDLEDVIVVATPKEHVKLRQQPLASTLISPQQMEDQRILSIKDLTAIAPSLFIPDYGSRITSAIYIRGMGSRINTPSVGLYVDNVPMLDKSMYDLSYYDVDRIDVLRGPQATLYGRNAMGGLIKVYTKSPMNYQGTDLRLSTSMYGPHFASLTHYHRISDQFAFSAGGFYEYTDGYLKNTFLDKNSDRGTATGGRLHAIYKPADRWTLDFNVDYQYSDQLGYAYGAYDKETGETADVAYDEQGSYLRNLLNLSLNTRYQGKGYTVSAVTGYQYLKDRMCMDQDFTPASIYTLEQKQRLHAVSEEITVKSSGSRRWEWLGGLFGFYQSLNTASPVTFKEEGVRTLLEENINGYMPAMLNARFNVREENLPVQADFDTPTFGLAAFHQSTLHRLLVDELSLTLGLRLDYEQNRMDYRSATAMAYDLPVMAMGYRLDLGNRIAPSMAGRLSKNYLQLLPKVALSYRLDEKNPSRQIYFSFSKGYRSGGYNIQMISDLMQTEMQAGLTDQIRTDMADGMTQAMQEAGVPQATIDRVVGMATGMIPETKRMDVEKTVVYKPEYCWNYEVGTHLDFFSNRLKLDAALFYTDIHDQQIARFVGSTLGRMMVNAGRSESYGGEVSLLARIYSHWTLTAAYGYTHATFKEYESGSEEKSRDYSGNYVPFIPRHTVNLGLRYDIPCASWSCFDKAYVSAAYSGAGRIYWTEKNEVSQDYYSLLDWNLGVTMGGLDITLWTKNLTDTEYNTFCFNNSTSTDKFFAQRGRPFRMGMDVRFRF